MQISNTIHYSSDPYLISKKQYEAAHQSETQFEETQSDISAQKIEEKIYSKSINALQPTQVVSAQQSTANSEPSSDNATAAKAVATYNAVENNQSSQEDFNQIKQMV